MNNFKRLSEFLSEAQELSKEKVVANKTVKLSNGMKVRDGEEYVVKTSSREKTRLASGKASFDVTADELAKYFDDVFDEKTGDKAEYQAFFKKALKKFGVTEPDQLEGKKKKEFFDYVDANWEGDNEED